jgi:flagellar motility protein MotE (MotC chaperone)
MLKILQSKVTLAALGVLVYTGSTAALLLPRLTAPPPANEGAPTVSSASQGVPSWEYSNPELEALVKELTAQREALAKREQQLRDLELRLQNERAEINQVTQRVHQLQRTLEKGMIRLKEEDTANLKRLAKTYGVMTPASAALIFKEMPDDQVVSIMSFMKDDQNAGILESMAKNGGVEIKRVAKLTDQLRSLSTRTNSPALNRP